MRILITNDDGIHAPGLEVCETIARAQVRSLKEAAVYSREGVTGERDPSSIGFAVLRGGDCVGEHTVIFAGTGEPQIRSNLARSSGREMTPSITLRKPSTACAPASR